jgi:hypothetical protein
MVVAVQGRGHAEDLELHRGEELMIEYLKYFYKKFGLGITLMVVGFGPLLLILFIAIFLHNFIGGLLAILLMIGVAGLCFWLAT